MNRAFGVAVLSALLTAAQQPQPGAITGRVVDTFGSLPGATVTITAPGVQRTVVTDPRGDFRVDALPPGTYRVRIELAPSFQASVTEAVTVEAGRTTPHSVLLDLAAGGASATDFGIRSRVGGLVGRVTDSSGYVLPGVTVTVSRPGMSRTSATDARGEYEISGLPSGRYQIEGTLTGFRRTVKVIVMGAGRETTGDFTLRLGISMGVKGGGVYDYVWPEGGVLGALRRASVVAKVRISETHGPRLIGRDQARLVTEHSAMVLDLAKSDREGLVPGQSLRFVQDAAGEVVEDGERYVGTYRPYESGQTFVVFLGREADGSLSQAYGPTWTLAVSDGRVALPSSPVPGQHLPPGLRAEMPVDELVAALRKLLEQKVLLPSWH